MKNKKLSIIVVLAITVFATMMCLYSSKLTEKSVTAGRIFSGESAQEISGCENCPENDCSDGDCSDSVDDIPAPNSPDNKGGKGVEPIKGERPPKPGFPHFPPKEKRN